MTNMGNIKNANKRAGLCANGYPTFKRHKGLHGCRGRVLVAPGGQRVPRGRPSVLARKPLVVRLRPAVSDDEGLGSEPDTPVEEALEEGLGSEQDALMEEAPEEAVEGGHDALGLDDLEVFPVLAHHRCGGCNRTFERARTLAYHITKCPALTSWCCVHGCTNKHGAVKVFKSKAALDGHLKTHQGQGSPAITPQGALPSPVEEVALELEESPVGHEHLPAMLDCSVMIETLDQTGTFTRSQPGHGQAMALVEFKKSYTQFLHLEMRKIAGRAQNSPDTISRQLQFCEKVLLAVMDFGTALHGGMRSVLGDVGSVQAVQHVWESLIDSAACGAAKKKTKLDYLNRLLTFTEQHVHGDLTAARAFIATRISKLRPLIRKARELANVKAAIESSSVFQQTTFDMGIGAELQVSPGAPSAYCARVEACQQWFQSARVEVASCSGIMDPSHISIKLNLMLMIVTLAPAQRKETYQYLQHGPPTAPLRVVMDDEEGGTGPAYIPPAERFRLVFQHKVGAWQIVQSQNKVGHDFELEIPPEMTLLIKEYLALLKKEIGGDGPFPIFPTADGRAAVPSGKTFSKWEKAFFEGMGLKGERFNLGRHALADHLVHLRIDTSSMLAEGYAIAMNTSTKELFGTARTKGGGVRSASYADPNMARSAMRILAQQHLRNLMFRDHLGFGVLSRMQMVRIHRVEGGEVLALKMQLSDGVLSMANPPTLWSVPLVNVRMLRGTMAPRYSSELQAWLLGDIAVQQIRRLLVPQGRRTPSSMAQIEAGWEGQLVLADGRLGERRWVERDDALHIQLLFYEQQAHGSRQTSSAWRISAGAQLECVLRSSVVFLFEWEVDMADGSIVVHK